MVGFFTYAKMIIHNNSKKKQHVPDIQSSSEEAGFSSELQFILYYFIACVPQQ